MDCGKGNGRSEVSEQNVLSVEIRFMSRRWRDVYFVSTEESLAAKNLQKKDLITKNVFEVSIVHQSLTYFQILERILIAMKTPTLKKATR